MIISLTGFMGSGKSCVGRELSELLSARFVDLDREIVRIQGCSISEIFNCGGETSFRKIETNTLKSVIEQLSGESTAVLSLGGGTITNDSSRKLILTKTRSVFLRTRFETIQKRIGKEGNNSRPLFVNADTLFFQRQAQYAEAEFTVDTDDLSPRKVALKIISLVGLYR